jgi:predicted nuclease with TOPRIM domain
MPRAIEEIVKALETYKTEIAATRDKLRDLEDEVSALREQAEDVIDSLTCAVDRLSELV